MPCLDVSNPSSDHLAWMHENTAPPFELDDFAPMDLVATMDDCWEDSLPSKGLTELSFDTEGTGLDGDSSGVSTASAADEDDSNADVDNSRASAADDIKKQNAELHRMNAALKEQVALAKQQADLVRENQRLRAEKALLMQRGWAWPNLYSPTPSPSIQAGANQNTRHNWMRPRPVTNDSGTAAVIGPPPGCFASTPDSDSSSKKYTTVIMKSLPDGYTRSQLHGVLEKEGYHGCYDFLYLPVDLKTGTSMGHAFVNLTTPEIADDFVAHFDGFRNWGIENNNVCAVTWSLEMQGFEDHIECYRNSMMMHKDVPDMYKPVIYQDGIRVPFPEPTKPLKVPQQLFKPEVLVFQ